MHFSTIKNILILAIGFLMTGVSVFAIDVGNIVSPSGNMGIQGNNKPGYSFDTNIIIQVLWDK